MNKARLKARADLANAEKTARRNPGDQVAASRVDRLRAEYRAVAADEYIRELVSTWPPLTASQRSTLAAILAPTSGSEAAA